MRKLIILFLSILFCPQIYCQVNISRKPVSALPSEYPLGTYVMDSETDSPYLWPMDAGVILGIKPTHSYFRHAQLLFSNKGNAISIRTKDGHNDNWGVWRNILVTDTNGNIKLSGTDSGIYGPSGTFQDRDRNVFHYGLTTHTDGYTNLSGFYGLHFFTEGTRRFTILKNGNIGIGTSSPEQSLCINTEQNKRALITVGAKGTADAGIYFDASDGDIKGADYGSLIQKDDLSIELNNYGDNPINIKTKGQTRLFIGGDGNVGIGKLPSNAKLDVAGNIKAHEIEVTLATMQDLHLNGTLAANNITYTANGNTADFVFEDNYQLKDLSEVEAFIKSNKHLPEIPSAEEMEKAGVNLAEMNKLLLMKVEELTLYSIEQDKKIEKEREERRAMRGEVNELKKLVMELVNSQNIPNP